MIRWPAAFRIVRNIYPPVGFFEDIAPPEDWDFLLAAAARWDSGIRDVVGNLALVPPARRVAGPTASLVMGTFTHVSKSRPSRFSDGSFGVWYCGDRFAVALAETAHHFERFARATNEPPFDSDYQELVAPIQGQLSAAAGADLLDPASWSAGQGFGRDARAEGADGVIYNSVRHPDGRAAALFWPDGVILPVQKTRQFRYHWDGARMTRYLVHGANAWTAYP